MNEREKLDALLHRALPVPDPAATARLRARLAIEIARRPQPTRPRVFWRLLPAGCGALGMATICAFWLGLAPVAAPAPDMMSAVTTLPFIEDAL